MTVQYGRAAADPAFQAELDDLYKHYVGRPSPLYFARRLTEHCGGARIYLKREDLNHTGSHKINNTLGQALLALRMGKPRVIAETGAGQHGVATATACAHFGLQCVVYMGEEDIRRQRPNVFSMKLLGAEVRPVSSGSRTLRDAVNEAFRDWMSSVETTHFCVGSVIGPHPFPRIVRDFQSIIGRETRAQSLEQFGRLPDVVVACVGGGSNAAGMFYPFIEDAGVELVGVEAGGRSEQLGRPRRHALLRPSRRAARGLQLRFAGRRRSDVRRAQRFRRAGLSRHRPRAQLLERHRPRAVHVRAGRRDPAGIRCRGPLEGILPALESSHALCRAMEIAARRKADEVVVVCLSGRGDKDAAEIARLRGLEF